VGENGFSQTKEYVLSTLIILVGNMGSGKSTVARTLFEQNGFLTVSGDGLRYLFSNGVYIYDERLQSLILDTEFELVDKLLKEGFSVAVDDSKNVSSGYRIAFIELAKKYAANCIAIELPRIPKEAAIIRRMSNPHGEKLEQDYLYWENVYNKFEGLYEPPDKEEGFDRVDKLEKVFNEDSST
jgi:predicted kinase